MKATSRAKKRPKIHRMLELILDVNIAHSDREIARSLSISKSTVARYRDLAHQKVCLWSDVKDLTDEDIRAFFNKPVNATKRKRQPDWCYVHKELQRTHVTLLLLWMEYRELSPETAMSYQHFCDCYGQHDEALPSVMRKRHQPGVRFEIDYSGDSKPIVDPETGALDQTRLFCGTLPYSGLLFAICTLRETDKDWVHATVQMLEYVGGIPQVITHDNASALVKTPRGADREPLSGALFQDLSRAYNFVPDPTRVRKPRDKGAVENTVGFVQRQILGALRNRVFHSMEALNAAIAVLVEDLNNRIMQGYKVSRRQRFEEKEKHLLRRLPKQRYECREYIELPPVANDYLVRIHGHRYSVPPTLVGQRLDAKLIGDDIEIVHQRTVVARHRINPEVGGLTILDEHMTPEHLAESKRNPEGFVEWAEQQQGAILAFCRHHFFEGCQPYVAMKKCQKLKDLVRKHGVSAVQSACAQAIALKAMTVTDISRWITLSEE